MHIAVMLTIGKHYNPAGTPSGYLTLAKNRIGAEMETPYLRSSSGRFIEVDPVTYASYADAKIGRTLDTQEIIDDMNMNGANLHRKPEETERKVKENQALNNFAESIPDVK